MAFVLGILYFLCLKFGLLDFFHVLVERLSVSLGRQALCRALCRGLGCSAGVGLFLLVIRVLSLETHMMDPSGSGGPQTEPVLEGRPIPKEQEWDAISSDKYCSSVVHIPGEIENMITLSKLSKLNAMLLFLKDHVFGGTIEPAYTREIQQELDQTDENCLAAKLEFIRRRECTKLGLPTD